MIRRFFLLCLLLAAVAPAAGAQTLTVADRARSVTLTREALLARPEARELVLARDPVYGRPMTYRAVPVAALLRGLAVGAEDYVAARATDDFSVAIPARLLVAPPGSGIEAWVAVETPTAPWPALPASASKGTAGPFYVVWQVREGADATSISGEYWAYHLAALTVGDSPVTRWPQLAVAPEVPAADPVRHGLDRFIAVCMACHRFDGAGEGTQGPDLARPLNPVQWFQPALLKRFIRDPKSVRDWPGAQMQASSPEALPDADIDAIVAWLAWKAGQR
jgi:mono/diheme cytochrome c family protein